MRTIIQVLTSPGMARLLLAQFLIYGQLFLAFSILPLYAGRLGGTALTTGIHTAIFTGVGLLLRFLLGPLADTHGRKLPLLLGAFVYASANGLLLFADDLLLLGLVRGYQGIALAAYPSAAAAVVLDLAPPESRGTALSLNRATMALALLLFPTGAELFLARWDYSALFLVGAALTTLAFLLLLSLPGPTPGPASAPVPAPVPAPASGPARLLAGFADVARRPAMPALLASVAVTALGYVGATSLVPLWLQSREGGEFGPFFLALGAGAFLAGFAGVLVDRYGAKTAILYALAATASGAVTLTGSAIVLVGSLSGPLLLLSGALLGSGFTMSMAAAPAWADQIVSSHRRATAMAMLETAIDAGVSLGLPLLGALGAWFGYGPAFLALAVGVLMILLMAARRT